MSRREREETNIIINKWNRGVTHVGMPATAWERAGPTEKMEREKQGGRKYFNAMLGDWGRRNGDLWIINKQ